MKWFLSTKHADKVVNQAGTAKDVLPDQMAVYTNYSCRYPYFNEHGGVYFYLTVNNGAPDHIFCYKEAPISVGYLYQYVIQRPGTTICFTQD